MATRTKRPTIRSPQGAAVLSNNESVKRIKRALHIAHNHIAKAMRELEMAEGSNLGAMDLTKDLESRRRK